MNFLIRVLYTKAFKKVIIMQQARRSSYSNLFSQNRRRVGFSPREAAPLLIHMSPGPDLMLIGALLPKRGPQPSIHRPLGHSEFKRTRFHTDTSPSHPNEMKQSILNLNALFVGHAFGWGGQTYPLHSSIYLLFALLQGLRCCSGTLLTHSTMMLFKCI